MRIFTKLKAKFFIKQSKLTAESYYTVHNFLQTNVWGNSHMDPKLIQRSGKWSRGTSHVYFIAVSQQKSRICGNSSTKKLVLTLIPFALQAQGSRQPITSHEYCINSKLKLRAILLLNLIAFCFLNSLWPIRLVFTYNKYLVEITKLFWRNFGWVTQKAEFWNYYLLFTSIFTKSN